jgi:phosphoenolpyruvate synthase/pyruvate phosphate dikinase
VKFLTILSLKGFWLIKTKGSRLIELRKSEYKNYFLDSILIQFNQIDKSEILIKEHFGSDSLKFAVRSSTDSEDQNSSNAGKFKTLLNVEFSNIRRSIEEVFESYEKINDESHVVIQPFLENVFASGVIFTADPNTGSPFFKINYSYGSNTELITSGTSNGNLLVISNLESATLETDLPVKDLIFISKELNEYFNFEFSDIEFAVIDEKIIILQIRPLNIINKMVNNNNFNMLLKSVHNKIVELSVPHPSLFGRKTIFSNMADWNPAELIGVRPKPLALSIFKDLISDSIWAYERGNLGYRNLRGFPIAIDFVGQPYIDTQVSFNSLLPNDLNNELGETLVNYYLDKLRSSPELHDKIEFSVVTSNYRDNFEQKILGLPITLSQKRELESSLISLTRNIILSKPYGLENSIDKSKSLIEKFEKISNSNLPNISKIYWLLEDCKRYGTLPFAGVARCAFIATDILRSMVESELLTSTDLDLFYKNIETIPSSLPYLVSELSKKEFLTKFGHLRPGTFEIENLTYAENYEKYFSNPTQLKRESYPMDEIQNSLRDKLKNSEFLSKLGIDENDLLKFCLKSIQFREDLKFLFSQNISLALSLLSEIGDELKIEREELSYLNVNDLYNAYRESNRLKSNFHLSIKKGQSKFLETKAVILPTLIQDSHDVFGFSVSESQPNFVTQGKCVGHPILINNSFKEVRNKIVFIENADPGFDWIFSHNIDGLITAYGGANSHMAVRCKELNIPAAIGVGESLFNEYVASNSILLDCRSKIIKRIS